MAPPGERRDFAFLYQSEQGTIDARLWQRSAAPLAAIFIALTIAWLFVRPYTARSLDQRGFFDATTLAANIFVLFYSVAVILLAISWVNLSAKRFRDRELTPPVGLAGIFPLVALFDGALRWLQPQMADEVPRWTVYIGDAAVFVAVTWTVAVCADLISRRPV